MSDFKQQIKAFQSLSETELQNLNGGFQSGLVKNTGAELASSVSVSVGNLETCACACDGGGRIVLRPIQQHF